jgi:hypothetical protein
MKRRGEAIPEALSDRAQAERVIAALRRCHAGIVGDVRRALDRWFRRRDYASAMAVKGPGAGDWIYAIDAVADRWVHALAREVGRVAPARILCEGVGEIRCGRGEPALRILVDPIDGTRALMADLRSAWVLTGIAPEAAGGAGAAGRAPTTADLWLSLQSEIPASDRIHRLEYLAIRGKGCFERRIALEGGASSPPRRFKANKTDPARGGYHNFLRYLPDERALLASVEAGFFDLAKRRLGLDPVRTYDDNWLCAAGQLWLVAGGRARMCADLRAWISREIRKPTIASHPYDLCALLVATEAGAPVLAVDRELTFPPLAEPLDLTTDVSFVAFTNEATKRRLLPILRKTLATFHEAFRRGR